MTRDDLVECAALLHAVRQGELDRLVSHDAPLDVLSQQIVAEASTSDWREDDLFGLVRRAWPYRALERESFDSVVGMLADGITTRRGRRGALIHRDEVQRRVTGRRSARLVAMTSGGAIPENADYRVVLDPEELFIGTLNEDFAIESNIGDIFQLGNRSWQVLQVGTGVVRVADAHGAPPSLPFWLGEAPARSAELSASVSELRRQLADRLVAGGPDRTTALRWLTDEVGLAAAAAEQIVDLLRGVAADSRRPADRGHDRPRAVLRRIGRDATGAARAVRQPCQSRVGARAQKALLPPVQLRAAGRRLGGCAAAVARPAALVSARRRVSLPAPEHRQGRADSSVSGRAGVSNPLAVERHRVACRAAESRGQEGARAPAADAGRRSAGRGLSRRRGVPGEHPGRPADSGSPAGQPDGA